MSSKCMWGQKRTKSSGACEKVVFEMIFVNLLQLKILIFHHPYNNNLIIWTTTNQLGICCLLAQNGSLSLIYMPKMILKPFSKQRYISLPSNLNSPAESFSCTRTTGMKSRTWNRECLLTHLKKSKEAKCTSSKNKNPRKLLYQRI